MGRADWGTEMGTALSAIVIDAATILKCLVLFGVFEVLGLLLLWHRLRARYATRGWPSRVCSSSAIVLRGCRECRLASPKWTCYLKATLLVSVVAVLATLLLVTYTLAFLSHAV